MMSEVVRDRATCLPPFGRLGAALTLAALAVVTPTGQAAADAGSAVSFAETAALRDAVTIDGVVRHLTALQAIADAHGGTRTAGTSGDAASVDYVAQRLRAAGYTVWFETFTLPLFEELRPPRLTVLGGAGDDGVQGDVAVRTMTFSGAGTVEGPVWPVGSRARNADADADRGCRPADFRGMPQGAVALARRGGCWLDRKVSHAVDAGAAAILVYDRDDDDGTGTAASRGELDEPARIPAVTLTHSTGRRLAQAARRGEVRVRLSVEARIEHRPTRNLLAERPVGDPERMVLVGAHLDSVPEGPGINDNASGAGAILEIARQLAELGPKTRNRLRFAFWAAEENGLLGSHEYAASLSPDELERIAAALNFDSLASPNYARFVYDGDGSISDEAGPPGSARIERILRDYFADAGLTVAEIDLEDGSDHLSFVEYGLPVGGLAAGDGELKSQEEAALFGGTAEAPYDPCYHDACDTLASINRTALDELSDAAAHAVLALGAEPWPRRAPLERD